jgi:hypothetical protein
MEVASLHGGPMRRLCAALCTLASVLGTIEVVKAQASPIPPGGEKCLAFSNLLNDARWRSRKNEQFRIEDPLKTLQYIQYASHNYFELLEPLGGFKSVPQAEELRAALRSVGIDFRPRQWSADPQEALLIYGADFNLDGEPDVAFERGKIGAPCSTFEFWRTDQLTGALSPMPGPEGWDSCDATSFGNEQTRVLATLYGEISVPVLASGKGLEADFFIYGLKQTEPSMLDNPQQQQAASASSAQSGVPPFCRVRLERKVDVMTKGPELCGSFAKQIHDVLYDRSYAIGEPAGRLLMLLQSRGANLNAAWRPIVLHGAADESQSALAGLDFAPLAEHGPRPRLHSLASVWVEATQSANDTLALVQGRTDSGQLRTLLVRATGAGVTVSEVPRALSPSDLSRLQTEPIRYDGRPFLLDLDPSESSFDIALTSLEPIERLCILDVRDHDMQSVIEYGPSVGPQVPKQGG